MPRFTALSEHDKVGQTTLDYPAKKHILLARDGKETFLIPDISQTLYFVGEMVPVASLNVNTLL